MVYSGSFSFLKHKLLEIFRDITPEQKTVVITHTNRMKQFLKEYLVSNLGIISNTKFYTLIDISKKLSQIEPIQDFDKKIIIKRAIHETGQKESDGLVEEISDIIQHIKEYKINIDQLKNDWIKRVFSVYEEKKGLYFDREDTHKKACESIINYQVDNIIIFGFRVVAPLHRDLFIKLTNITNKMFVFLPVILESGYSENHGSFIEAVEFFQNITKTKPVYELVDNFDQNINIGRTIYRFDYQNLPLPAENIKIFSCQDEEEEIKYVASKIVELVLDGVKFHEIGIVIPAISKYIPFIGDLFPKYLIPYYIIEDNRFIDNVLYRSLFNLFKLKENELSKDSILNFLAQDILTLKDVENIINIIETAPYLESIEDWEKYVFSKLDDESLKDVITKIFTLPDKSSLAEYIKVFRYLINSYVNNKQLVEFAENIFIQLENNQLYKSLFNQIEYQEFVSLIELFFNRENKTTKPNYETVNILSPNTAQGNNFKHVFVVGLNSGIFPQTLREEFLEVTGRNEHILIQEISSFCTLFDRGKNFYFSFIRSSVHGRNLAPSFFIYELLRITDKKIENPEIKKLFLNSPQIKISEKSENSYKFDFVEINFPISVTSFAEYMICPYKFFLSKLMDIHRYKIYDKKVPPYKVGQFVHRLMQSIYMEISENPDIDIELINKKISDDFEDFINKEFSYIIPSRRLFEYLNLLRIKNNIIEFLKEDIQKIKKGQKTVRIDFVEKLISDENFIGKIDRLDTEDGNNILYDYKTGKFSSQTESIKEAFQLMIYKKILEKKYGVNVDRLLLLFLNNDKYELEEVSIQEQIIEDNLQKLKEKYFSPVKDKSICNRCDYRDICDLGGQH